MIDFFGLIKVNGAYVVLALLVLLIISFALTISTLCKYWTFKERNN